MVPLWIAVTFIAVASFFMVQTVPEEQKFYQVAEAERDMVSILAYRKALQNYIKSNPAATGTISAATLSAPPSFWPTGYTYQAGTWQNYIDTNGTLYIYSLFPVITTSTDNNILLSKLYEVSDGSELMGTKASGAFVSYTGASTWPIPAVIPDDSIVIIGK